MIKWILGGTFLTLGIEKLVDLQHEDPAVGNTLTLIVGALWLYSAAKEFWGAKK
jgi:hypothetical protein